MSRNIRSIGSTTDLAASQEKGGRAFIFAIGINAYQHFQPLEYAATDVQHLVQVLTGRYQFDQADVKLLLDEDATRSNIHRHFRHLAQTVQKNDSVVVLFSGHGTYDKVLDKGYWIPVDARPEDTGSYIANIEIAGFLESINSLHTLVISDSCFSGKLFGRTRFVSRADLLESTPSRWMMTSGRAELVPDKSKFAASLTTYLEKNKQPELRFNDVFQSIYSAVVNNSWQTPRYEPLQNVGHEGGEFILRFKGYEAPDDLASRARPEPVMPEPGETSPTSENIAPPKSMLEKPGVQIGIAVASIAFTALLLAMIFPGWFGLKRTGALQAKPEIVGPSLIDIGTVSAGKDTTFEFTVQNNGDATAHLWPVAYSCQDLQILNNLADSIGGKQPKRYTAVWNAGQIEGARECTLTLSGANLQRQVVVVAKMEVKQPTVAVADPQPQNPPAGPAVAQIVAVQSSIDLGDMEAGQSKKFNFKLRNQGKGASTPLKMTMTYDDGTHREMALTGMAAGSTKTYTGIFEADKDSGTRRCTLTIEGQPARIVLKAMVIADLPPQPVKGTFSVQVNTGGVQGIRIWVADDLTGETYDITTNGQMMMSLKIPQRMNGKTIVVNFERKGQTDYRSWKLSPGAVIDVPERLRNN
jgi:hypothetical protein